MIMSKLFIICGHGAGDCGACGNGYTEAERVRVLGKRMKQLGGDSVVLGDVSRDYYADGGINSLTISKDYQILELHLDCSSNTTAHGGHIIIKSGFSPDKYDYALAKYISQVFPGRSNNIVYRNNLSNVNRAAKRGYSYRLIECCFISNSNDMSKFNREIDNVAIGLLNCFGIATTNKPVSKPQNEIPKPEPKPPKVEQNTTTKDLWVSQLQSELNKQGWRDASGKTLDVDGIWGSKTLQACPMIKRGASGGLTKLIQQRLNSVDFSLSTDGVFGTGTENAIKVFQRNRGLDADGIVGKKTWEWLLKGTKM